MSEITVKSTLSEVYKLPQFAAVAPYLVYDPTKDLEKGMGNPDEVTIEQLKNIGWSPESVVKGVNTLKTALESGKAALHYVYTEAERSAEPDKKCVNFVRLQPENIDPKKPWIVLCAGGAYVNVCSLAEGYPVAADFLARGYQVFVFTYRAGQKGVMPKAVSDLAACIRYILAHAKEFEIETEEYAVGGFSAGGNLICTFGMENVGYKAFGLPKPRALFPVYAAVDLDGFDASGSARGFMENMLGSNYTAEDLQKYSVYRHIDENYPPCYIVCGKDDGLVPCENSEKIYALLKEHGVPAVLDEGEHAPHGFGDGTGTDAAGWIDRAADFLQKL